MKFYHYTSAEIPELWGSENNRNVGLIPKQRFIPLGPHSSGLPKKANDAAIFGLLSPMDRGWCTQAYVPDIPLLEAVLRDIRPRGNGKICLLEVSLTPSDDAHLADYGVHLVPDYDGTYGDNRTVAKQVKANYWNSLVPFSEYKRSSGAHLIPEVVCFSPLPLDRLRVIKIQDRKDVIDAVREHGGFVPRPTWPKVKPLGDVAVPL